MRNTASHAPFLDARAHLSEMRMGPEGGAERGRRLTVHIYAQCWKYTGYQFVVV